MEDKTSDLPDYCRKLTIRDANGMLKELIFPKSLDLDRPKRARTTFSSEQLNQLERIFVKNQYLVGRERSDLAKILNLSETQVKVWFQNRRTKHKRDQMKQSDDEKSGTPESAVCSSTVTTTHCISPTINYSSRSTSIPTSSFSLLSNQTECAPFSVDYLMQSPAAAMMNPGTAPGYSTMSAYQSSTAAALAATLCFSNNPPNQYSCMIGSPPSSMFDLQQQLLSHFTNGTR